MKNKKTVVVLGAKTKADIPGVEKIQHEVRLVFAGSREELRLALPGSEILLSWDFRADKLMQAWECADQLQWIHWCGAGVDAALFPALRQSDVVLTNARGIFDRPMAEYVLGLILAMAKNFPQTFAAMAVRSWAYGQTETIENRRALIVGAGSIGRCIARLLRSAGMQVSGIGRTHRSDDPDFAAVYGVADLVRALGEADFVISALPLTDATRNLFSQAQFSAMKATARFINVGRGASVDEAALIQALKRGDIAGAALDVFQTEPLPADSPLWSIENLIISPHMSGDFFGHQLALLDLFADNLQRYLAGVPLINIVDKKAGFVST